jgi:hypothetical protein
MSDSASAINPVNDLMSVLEISRQLAATTELQPSVL